MSFFQPPPKWTWGRELPLYILHIFQMTVGSCSLAFSLVHCLCIEGACLYTPTDFSRFVFSVHVFRLLLCTFSTFSTFLRFIFLHNYSTIFTCLIISHSRQGLLAKCKSGDPDKLIVVTFMQSTNQNDKLWLYWYKNRNKIWIL